MSDLLGPTTRAPLEARLADLATAIAFPPTPDLAAAVGSRLRARPRLLPSPRSIGRSLLLAAALALLVVGAAFAVRFGLALLSIEFQPLPTPTQAPASASPRTSAALGSGLGLGRALSIDEVELNAAFDIVVPGVLGLPAAVYLGGSDLRGQVSLVYTPRDDLPASALLNGAGLLITQNRGEADAGLAHKVLDSSDATVESVDVDGSPGVWISGAPHFFWYLATDGTFINDSRRVVGDTLAWERDGVLYRIEGAIPLASALEIASSMR
jgi:hypothetical protein